jgi:TRAP-type C4-dicarboxylate transport system substrate-binding protein
MHKILVLIGCCLLTMNGTAQLSQAAQNWKIGHVRPAGSAVDTDVKELTDTISAATDGLIDFTIYPANKLATIRLSRSGFRLARWRCMSAPSAPPSIKS